MVKLYVQPSVASVPGFFFETIEEYREKIFRLWVVPAVNVGESEIKFIDGKDIDREVFEALDVNKDNIGEYLRVVKQTSFRDKVKLIIRTQVMIYCDSSWEEVKEWDIEIYEFASLKDLAIHMVKEGFYGDVPESLELYIDYDKLSHHLRVDYAEITVSGKNYVYSYC